MNLGETAKLALRSLLLQKFRAVLTALGIVIGVAAVIAMLSISEGARREALEQVRLMGVNNLRVRSVKPIINERKKQDQAESGGWISRYGVTPSDLAHLRVLSPEIDSAFDGDLNWRRELWENFYPRIRKENSAETAAEKR